MENFQLVTKINHIGDKVQYSFCDSQRNIITFAKALTLLQTSPPFVDLLVHTLNQSFYSAFFFECQPVSVYTMDTTPFTFVIIDAPALSKVSSQPQAFASHFRPGSLVATFPNTRGDAMLVAPSGQSGYNSNTNTHLAQ